MACIYKINGKTFNTTEEIQNYVSSDEFVSVLAKGNLGISKEIRNLILNKDEKTTNEVREVEDGQREKGNEGKQSKGKNDGQKTNDVQNEEVTEGGVKAPQVTEGKPIAEQTQEKEQEATEKEKDLGYHGGNLQEKSDYLTEGYRGDMPFTGYYFFSDRERAEGRGNRTQSPNKEVSVIDFSQYNLLKPTTNEYWAAKSGLKRFEDKLLKNGIDAAFQSLEDYGGMKYSYPKLYEQIVANRSKIEKVAKDWVEKELNNIDTKKRIERLETIILKTLGYEGVDVRGLKESNGEASPDSSSEGSVIFDIKPNSIKESPTSKKNEQEATPQVKEANVKAIEEAITKKSGTIKNEIIKEAANPTEVKKILDNLDAIKSKLAGLKTKDGDSVFSEECKWG